MIMNGYNIEIYGIFSGFNLSQSILLLFFGVDDIDFPP